MTNDIIRMEDLTTNPDTRVAVGLVLDRSGSMNTVKSGGVPTGKTAMIDGKLYDLVTGGHTRLATLQEGVDSFYNAIYEDECARYSAEIAVVAFNDTAEVLSDFSRVEYDDERVPVPQLKASGNTALGAAINMTLDLLEKRKEEYKKAGVDYYQPWLVIITDGEDNGSVQELNRARARITELVGKNKLSVYPFIIGTDQGKATLATLSPKQAPLRIDETQMKGLFTWLGKSIAAVSSGAIGSGSEFSLDEFVAQSWSKPLT